MLDIMDMGYIDSIDITLLKSGVEAWQCTLPIIYHMIIVSSNLNTGNRDIDMCVAESSKPQRNCSS